MYLPPVSIAQSWNFNQKQKEDFPNETLPSLSSPLPPPPPPHFLRHILNQVFNFSISTSNFPQIETNSKRGLSESASSLSASMQGKWPRLGYRHQFYESKGRCPRVFHLSTNRCSRAKAPLFIRSQNYRCMKSLFVFICIIRHSVFPVILATLQKLIYNVNPKANALLYNNVTLNVI